MAALYCALARRLQATNRYANLREAFQHAVFIDRDVWEHFGSEERILEVLRLLVDIARKRSGPAS
jgi:hypothetical protein